MKRIEHIQSLRAIAAGLVVAAHAIEYMVRREALPERWYAFAYLVGWLGVTTFFVISGLIMVRSSWNEFGVPHAPARFIVRRLIRIVPLYWLATVCSGVRHVVQGHELKPDELVKSLLFIPYLSDGMSAMRPIAGQGWTLNYEIGFYLLFALSLLFPRRLAVAGVIAALCVLTGLGALVRPLVPYQDSASLAQFWTDPIILWFGVGAAIGFVEQRSTRWLSIRHPFTVAVLLLLATAALPRYASIGFPLQIAWQAVMGLVCAAAVIVCTSAHADDRVWRWLQDAGDASYSVYLFHPFILSALIAVWSRLPPHSGLQHPLLFIAISVVTCGFCGRWIFRRIERPVTERLRSRLASRKARASGEVASTTRQIL